jgi:hypothetical protein
VLHSVGGLDSNQIFQKRFEFASNLTQTRLWTNLAIQIQLILVRKKITFNNLGNALAYLMKSNHHLSKSGLKAAEKPLRVDIEIYFQALAIRNWQKLSIERFTDYFMGKRKNKYFVS